MASEFKIITSSDKFLNRMMDISQDRLYWFPNTYSNNKKGIIYKNSILNCQSDYGCGTEDNCIHDPPWKLFKFEEYFKKDHYGHLTIGCSYTYGSEIKKEQTWRSFLTNSIDISVPGIGIDGMWQNLKYLTKQEGIKFDKIVIVLPDLCRKTFRVKNDDQYFNFIICPVMQDESNVNFAFHPREMKRLQDKFQRFVVMRGEEYGRRVLARMVKWLNCQEFEFYISSWDNEVYRYLKKNIDQERLLEKFDTEYEINPNIKHASPLAHSNWFNRIKNRIT